MASSFVAQRPKLSKRRLVCSDDDDDDDNDDNDDGDHPPATRKTKRARTVDTDPPLSVEGDDDDDIDIDIETSRGSAQRSLSATDDSRFLPEDGLAHDPSVSHKARAPKKHKGSPAVFASTKKKSQTVYSDDEESDSHMEHDPAEDVLSDSTPPLAELSDDDFELDIPPKRGAPKAKTGPTNSKAAKAKAGQLKGVTTKGLKERERDKEIHMKDERKPGVAPATSSRASSTAAQSQPNSASELFTNDDHVPSSTVDPLPDASQSAKDPLGQAMTKKRKLPPIKKTKTGASAASTSTPATTAPKPAPPPAQEVAKPLLPTSEQRKQALTGVRDIDLADSKVYAELFRGAGGNTPKSGLKNAEERRKELDKMRDEARARRNEEAKYTFDLQRQADKIARFEQRLRAENSTVLHPNFLAAKFREEWELDRRNRRVTPKEEGEA